MGVLFACTGCRDAKMTSHLADRKSPDQRNLFACSLFNRRRRCLVKALPFW